ncbi:hypothetical protein CROQUDRAFT_51935 [Cronartium quercuum f. sp. fusiforme G11]|uniref:Chorismate mutase domain-containing protein n=1 Tax=Cronartium quercuum f. sp. fusiforme G11 TaxID=708437 RepID=A0A9P6NCM9_9BASI|nr:hypothetical protein CROQUDRAFT_51935 [Cronartium quercuum f. sp. fusiforme G11]
MWSQTLLNVIIASLISSVLSKPRTLDSVPLSTNLPLPLTQNLSSFCFTESQAFQGPTVDQWGNGLYYGPKETVNMTKGRTEQSGSAVWGQPSIRFPDGSTCCDHLEDARAYINYLDSTIIAYLALRQQFVVEAGRFKESREAVRAVERAVEVVKKAESLASEYGLARWIANVSEGVSMWGRGIGSLIDEERYKKSVWIIKSYYILISG